MIDRLGRLLAVIVNSNIQSKYENSGLLGFAFRVYNNVASEIV